MKTIAAIAVALGIAASPASAFIAFDSYRVDGDASRFMVQYEPGAAARNYWCAAGDFALRRLNVNPTTPIYRISPKPLPRMTGMMFSLSPEGATDDTGIFVIPNRGYLSAGFADSLCETRRMKR
ncbi:hypothetical protein [Falsirhodobacter halotolerans]|uniref:hypothetical protein n=1 Tax=Falsirhodobacter halotolerans TaxID=1146892 RepID=UPI001FD32087|nr:hypothetical protein [Falsirhodobacter halotolerans]MCJ8139680.1 hypothetical protein [Falsirhodobacter halotolerans]